MERRRQWWRLAVLVRVANRIGDPDRYDLEFVCVHEHRIVL